ncbi:MAG TPA: hypothetical protein VIM77_10360 [Mucilaginibacter sp.]
MKVKIFISGQINSVATLARAIPIYIDGISVTSDYKEFRMAGTYTFTCPTKAIAKKALWQAFVYLRKTLDNPNVGSMSGLRYAKGLALYWDAGEAKII